MSSPQIFDDQEYTFVVMDLSSWEEVLEPDYSFVIEELRMLEDNRQRIRPKNLTVKWVVEEIGRACSRDLTDSYYNDEVMLAFLEEVIYPRGNALIVFNGRGHMVGKIEYFMNDEAMTLNVMGLYVFGDRRRSVQRNAVKQNINGAYLIWYFAGVFAKQLYGNLARVLVTFPRPVVDKHLYQVGARFVILKEPESGEMIEHTVESCPISFHKNYVRSIAGLSDDKLPNGESYGALMAAADLTRRIEETEALFAAIR